MDGSTVPTDVPSIAEERRARLARRAGLAVFTVVVVLGVTGQLGVRSATSSAAGDGLEVSLVHAAVARPALAVPYHLTIHREGGFDGPVEVRISTGYLAALDENGTQPYPDRSWVDGEHTIWEFEPPDGDVLVVWIDTRVEPGQQWRRDGSTTVISDGDRVRVDHPIWILP